MQYTRPELISLNATGSPRGNCVNGSGAAAFGSPCTTGIGDAGWCADGLGNGGYCKNGTAATRNGGRSYCDLGTSPLTTCAIGTAPAV